MVCARLTNFKANFYDLLRTLKLKKLLREKQEGQEQQRPNRQPLRSTGNTRQATTTSSTAKTIKDKGKGKAKAVPDPPLSEDEVEKSLCLEEQGGVPCEPPAPVKKEKGRKGKKRGSDSWNEKQEEYRRKKARFLF